MRKLRFSFYLFILTTAFGILAYHFIEGMSYSDAIFMTAITISTVGFGEVQPLSLIGRVITIFIILFGITIAGYNLGTFIRMLVEGEISERFGRNKEAKKILNLKNHYIVCGFGRIGKLITKE